MAETFQHRDMSGSVFHDVNLHHASFEDVNLAEATMHGAYLADLSISGSNIQGMTIDGIRVDLVIEAELNRRDPERVRLRMADPYDPECVRSVLERLDEVRKGFRALLRSVPQESLKVRPDQDHWSVVEHIRHLIFAEDQYTNRRLLRNDTPWCKLGLLPTFLAENASLADVGSDPTDDVETLLAAWEAIHIRMLGFVAGVTPEGLRRDASSVEFGRGTVGSVLQLLAEHDLEHIRQAEAAIGQCIVPDDSEHSRQAPAFDDRLPPP